MFAIGDTSLIRDALSAIEPRIVGIDPNDAYRGLLRRIVAVRRATQGWSDDS